MESKIILSPEMAHRIGAFLLFFELGTITNVRVTRQLLDLFVREESEDGGAPHYVLAKKDDKDHKETAFSYWINNLDLSKDILTIETNTHPLYLVYDDKQDGEIDVDALTSKSQGTLKLL